MTDRLAEGNATWDESMVREGCMCGHGQYHHHGDLTTVGRCFVAGCDCKTFRRDRRGDRDVVEHVHAWAEYGNSVRHVVWEQCRCGERTPERPTHNPFLFDAQDAFLVTDGGDL